MVQRSEAKNKRSKKSQQEDSKNDSGNSYEFAALSWGINPEDSPLLKEGAFTCTLSEHNSEQKSKENPIKGAQPAAETDARGSRYLKAFSMRAPRSPTRVDAASSQQIMERSLSSLRHGKQRLKISYGLIRGTRPSDLTSSLINQPTRKSPKIFRPRSEPMSPKS